MRQHSESVVVESQSCSFYRGARETPRRDRLTALLEAKCSLYMNDLAYKYAAMISRVECTGIRAGSSSDVFADGQTTRLGGNATQTGGTPGS